MREISTMWTFEPLKLVEDKSIWLANDQNYCQIFKERKLAEKNRRNDPIRQWHTMGNVHTGYWLKIIKGSLTKAVVIRKQRICL